MELSELPSPGQLLSDGQIREAETSDCKKQNTIIPITQSHGGPGSSLSQTTMNKKDQRLGRKEIQMKETHSHMS